MQLKGRLEETCTLDPGWGKVGLQGLLFKKPDRQLFMGYAGVFTREHWAELKFAQNFRWKRGWFSVCFSFSFKIFKMNLKRWTIKEKPRYLAFSDSVKTAITIPTRTGMIGFMTQTTTKSVFLKVEKTQFRNNCRYTKIKKVVIIAALNILKLWQQTVNWFFWDSLF